MVAKKYEEGNVYGRLTVLREASASDGRGRWECLCECGNVTQAAGAHLRNGSIRSCGCLASDTARARALRDKIGGYKGYAKYKGLEDYLAATRKVNGCCLWEGPTYPNGYAKFPKNSRIPTEIGHRSVFFLVHGYLPSVVRHTCDVRNCINPDHLLGGTTRDNIMDRVLRKRDLHMRKLTEDDVRAIRTAYETEVPRPGQRVLARRYGVSKPTISSILKRKTWSHV